MQRKQAKVASFIFYAYIITHESIWCANSGGINSSHCDLCSSALWWASPLSCSNLSYASSCACATSASCLASSVISTSSSDYFHPCCAIKGSEVPSSLIACNLVISDSLRILETEWVEVQQPCLSICLSAFIVVLQHGQPLMFPISARSHERIHSKRKIWPHGLTRVVASKDSIQIGHSGSGSSLTSGQPVSVLTDWVSSTSEGFRCRINFVISQDRSRRFKQFQTQIRFKKSLDNFTSSRAGRHQLLSRTRCLWANWRITVSSFYPAIVEIPWLNCIW